MAHNADEFLKYIAENEKELKAAVRKNITYDSEIFEDAWGESVVKVYDSIVRNDKQVKDFKMYFFMAMKWNYVNMQNSKRRRDSSHTDITTGLKHHRPIFDESYDEDEEAGAKVSDMRRRCEEVFGETRSDVFFRYWYAKTSRGGTTYAEIAEDCGLTTEFVGECIRVITPWFREHKYLNATLF